MIYGANGLPIHSDRTHTNGTATATRASSLFSATDYLQALDTIGAPARNRAREPLTNHPWVFAAAIMIAMVAGQASFRIFRETEKTVGKRKEMARRAGRMFSRRFGHNRTAIQRHGMASLERRAVSTALEPDDEHEMSVLLRRPNPLQDGTQLMGTTFLGLAADSEFFWIRTGTDGRRIAQGARPLELWPVLGSQVREVHERQTGGKIIGWDIKRPRWMPGGSGSFAAERFRVDEVIVFKGPNPSNPARGLSRLTAAASAIEADMLAKSFQRDHLRRGGTPKGFIKFKGEMSEADKRKFLTKMREEYEGAEAMGRIGLLEGDFDWEQLGGQIEDIQFIEQLRNDREEILAVLGVPPSQLGSVQFTNYATALAQNKVFWENTIGPMLRSIESALDSTLFFSEPDDVVGLFDVSSVEALLAGLSDKISAAEQMSKETLHVPPRIAFQRVGVEMPEYDGDDVAFVGALATPAKVAIEIANEEEAAVDPPPPPAPDDDGQGDVEDDAEDEDVAKGVHDRVRSRGGFERSRAPGVIVRSSKDDRIKRMRQFVKVESALERVMRVRYRRWVAQERDATLKRFDKAARDAKSLLSGARMADVAMRAFDVGVVLPDLTESGSALQLLVRPVYAGILTETYDFTSDDIGMPTFEIDDDALIRVLAQREKHFTARMPKRVSDQLMRSLQSGIQGGETMEQLRQRVDTVYKFSASKQKSLVVARTETAGAMNGIRDEMFGMAGVEEQFWTNAEDAAVRPSHEVFGDSGAHPRGFNFMSLIGEAGSLTFPNDPNGPAKEVIQCRCVAIPA